MKSDEEFMEILEAFDLTESLRDAAELAGCSHNTVAHYVVMRDAGGLTDLPAARPQLIDEYLAKVEEWMERSTGKARADVVHDKLLAMGYAGSERTTRRAVAGVRRAFKAGRVRVHRPWVTEPGMWLQYDFGDGPVIDGRKTTLFCAWLAWCRSGWCCRCGTRRCPVCSLQTLAGWRPSPRDSPRAVRGRRRRSDRRRGGRPRHRTVRRPTTVPDRGLHRARLGSRSARRRPRPAVPHVEQRHGPALRSRPRRPPRRRRGRARAAGRHAPARRHHPRTPGMTAREPETGRPHPSPLPQGSRTKPAGPVTGGLSFSLAPIASRPAAAHRHDLRPDLPTPLIASNSGHYSRFSSSISLASLEFNRERPGSTIRGVLLPPPAPCRRTATRVRPSAENGAARVCPIHKQVGPGHRLACAYAGGAIWQRPRWLTPTMYAA